MRFLSSSLRYLLLRVANGVEREELERSKEVLSGAEGECSALKLENRQLKTRVKELMLKVGRSK